jgi:hypothetical protein
VIPAHATDEVSVTNKPPAGLTDDDYDAIEAAVMETARGRWFLLEYDRRRRAAETTQLLEAVTRLERAVGSGGQPALAPPPKQVALPRPASEPLQHLSVIGERLQDIAWNMRERGFDDTICSAIEEQASLVLGQPEPAAGPAPILGSPSPDPRLEALARIDRMPLAEKLALFV